jgi:hypothetical protein
MDLKTEQATTEASAQDRTELCSQLERQAEHWNSRYTQSLGLPEWAASRIPLLLVSPDVAVYHTMSKANETLANLLQPTGESVKSPSQNCSDFTGYVKSLNENDAYTKLYPLFGAWEQFAIDTGKVLSAVTKDESVDASGRNQIAQCYSQLTDHVSHSPIENKPQWLNSSQPNQKEAESERVRAEQ